MNNKTRPEGGLRNIRSRYPLLYHAVAICAVLAVLALASHFIMQAGTRHNSRRTVPDFTGMPFSEAQRLAQHNDLRLFVNDSLFVASYDGGAVLDQLPAGGTEVKPGRTIYLTINAYGRKMVDVPYVAGRSLRQAKNMLETAGLEIERLIYIDNMATNFVLEQSYDGRRIERDSPLKIEQGSGVTLRVGAAEGSVTAVPKVIGLTLRAAKGRLWEAGLNVGRVRMADDIDRLTADNAAVWAQSLTPGTESPLGAEISLDLTLDASRIESASLAADRAMQQAIRLNEGGERTSDGIDSLLLKEIE
ncbi:MAG: PASTA domain-containing protein [Alistipes sp.]|nr:PASTA domain-containing protein [Alistipes sp.]